MSQRPAARRRLPVLLRPQEVADLPPRSRGNAQVRLSRARLLHTLRHAELTAENAVDIATRLTEAAYTRLIPHPADPREGCSLVVRDRVLAAAAHVAERELASSRLWGEVCWDFIADRLAQELNAGLRCTGRDIDAFIRDEARENAQALRDH